MVYAVRRNPLKHSIQLKLCSYCTHQQNYVHRKDNYSMWVTTVYMALKRILPNVDLGNIRWRLKLWDEMKMPYTQRWQKTFEVGGGGVNWLYACVSTHMLGGVGVCSPRKILQIRCSESVSEATFGPKQHYSYRCYLYVFVRRAKSPNFWVSSAEYCIGLLSLGRGHNIARLNTRAPWSLRHAARLENSWPGQSGSASI